MTNQAFLRFIHASNFRPGQVASGIGECSSAIRQGLLDAPWTSMQSVFDQAISQRVDFVLLNGQMLPSAIEQTRTLTFLADRFAKLAEHGIEVFWRTSERTLQDDWLQCFSWPANVHFVTDSSAALTYTRDGSPVATVTGGEPARNDLFSVMLSDRETVTAAAADYVATCGLVRSDSIEAGRTVHSPGAVQGLGFHEPGAHGCSLVELDHNNSLSIAHLETSPLVWESLRMSVPAGTTALRESLRSELSSTVPGPTRILNVLLDSANTSVALELETRNLDALREQLQPTGDSANYWVSRLEVAAGMTVGKAAYDNACIQDFHQLVHHRGEPCAQSLRSRSAFLTSAPQSQLLTDVARLGAELLS